MKKKPKSKVIGRPKGAKDEKPRAKRAGEPRPGNKRPPKREAESAAAISLRLPQANKDFLVACVDTFNAGSLTDLILNAVNKKYGYPPKD